MTESEAVEIDYTKAAEEHAREMYRPGRAWEALWLMELGNTLENMPPMPPWVER